MAGGERGGVLGRFARPRLYQQLADHITDFIDAQGLSPGDRLPPERALAAQLGVSRATLSRALVALEVAGRVEVRHGDGAVVRDPSDAAGALVAVLAAYPAAEREGLRGLVRAHPSPGSGLLEDLERALAALDTADGEDR